VESTFRIRQPLPAPKVEALLTKALRLETLVRDAGASYWSVLAVQPSRYLGCRSLLGLIDSLLVGWDKSD